MSSKAEQYAAWRATPEGRSKILIKDARRRAEKRGIEFNLTYMWLLPKLLNGVCEISGLPFDLKPSANTTKNPRAPSLDKIDPSKGYTEDNVQVICDQANTAKGEYSEEDLEQFCIAYLHQRRSRK